MMLCTIFSQRDTGKQQLEHAVWCRGQEVNGKPVYEKDPSTMPMVWASNGYWYVGKRDELGKQVACMSEGPLKR